MYTGRLRSGMSGMSCTDEEIPFSMTPILEDSLQLLMVACISVRDNSTNASIGGQQLLRIGFQYSDGICPEVGMKATGLDMLSIRLTSLDCINPVYDLLVTLDEGLCKEAIRLPYLLSGCRASYFPVSCLNGTVCIVHQLLEVSDEFDVFVEEQEFLFSAMEIQDELFLSSAHPPLPVPYIDSSVVSDKEEDVFSQELRFLSSIMDRYAVTN